MFDARDLDLESAVGFLTEHGYVVLEGMLDQSSLEQISNEVDRIFAQEREAPYDPGDGQPAVPRAASAARKAKGRPITVYALSTT